MRRLISAFTALAFILSAVGQAAAADRPIAYPAENPSSTQANLGQRYVRITLGNWVRDALGPNASASGVYSNLTLTPGTGLYVTVNPSAANSYGTVYQLVQDDPNPIPSAVPAGVPTSPSPLPADATQIAVQATQKAASAPLGPFTAPGTSGQGIYYLIEAQITSGVDNSSQSMLFVSASGGRSYIPVNNTRSDVLAYQVKAGTASTTPTAPSVDSGWIAIGYVGVPYGATQTASSACPGSIPPSGLMSGACVTMAVPFSGFVQNATVVHVSTASSPTPDTGNAAITGQFAASQLISTASTGTPPLIVNSTTQVANLNAATAGTAGNVTGIVAVANGGTGSSAPTGTTCGASANLSCTGGFPNTVVDLKSSISLTGVTATNGTVTALTLPGLTNQSCLGTNSSGAVQAGSCLASFTVNGTTPINVSQVGSTATVSCPTCVASNTANTFSAAQTLAATGTATSGTQHYPSYALQLQSNDWSGSAGVNTTGTLTFANGVFTFGPANSNLQVNGSTTIGPAGNATSSTNYGSNGGFGLQNSLYIGTPGAPALFTVAGTSNGAAEYIKITEVNAAGETLASANSTVSPTTAQQVQVGGPPQLGNATGWNIYESTASGGTYYLQNTGGPIALGTPYTVPGTPLSSGTQPPTLGGAGQTHTWQWTADNAGNLLAQYDSSSMLSIPNSGGASSNFNFLPNSNPATVNFSLSAGGSAFFSGSNGNFDLRPLTESGQITIQDQNLNQGCLSFQPGTSSTILNGGGCTSISGFTSLKVGSSPAATSTGDGSFSRSTTSGAIEIGGVSASGLFDYGVTTANQFTVNAPFNIAASGGFLSNGPGVVRGQILVGGTAYNPASGDGSFSESTSTGRIYLGGTSSKCAIDYGVTTSGTMTIGCPLANVQSTGNLIIPPAGTATSGTNYASAGALEEQTSQWNGSAAVTHNSNLYTDTSGDWLFQYDAATQATISKTGALTLAASGASAPIITAGASNTPSLGLKLFTNAGAGTFTDLGANQTASVNGVSGAALYVDKDATTNLLALDRSGNLSILGTLNSSALGVSSVICTDASKNLTTTGCAAGDPGATISADVFQSNVTNGSSSTFAGTTKALTWFNLTFSYTTTSTCSIGSSCWFHQYNLYNTSPIIPTSTQAVACTGSDTLAGTVTFLYNYNGGGAGKPTLTVTDDENAAASQTITVNSLCALIGT